MTIIAEGKMIKWVNTVMLSLITAGIIWSGTTLVNIREAITKQIEINNRYESMFTEVNKTAEENKEILSERARILTNHESRISVLEAKRK